MSRILRHSAAWRHATFSNPTKSRAFSVRSPASYLIPSSYYLLHASSPLWQPTLHRPFYQPIYHNIRPFSSLEQPKEASPQTSLPVKKPLSQRIKDELIHYWDGTKLLATEVRISTKLVFKILRGEKLIRREKRQLKRTLQDLLRLVPFAFFIIVPFMELLLPVVIKLFPNLLPSTFEDKFSAEEKKRRLLRVRLEMAKYLQETLAETAISSSNPTAEGAKHFTEFFRKFRNTGQLVPTEEILEIAKNFRDDITLNNLSRPQLMSMCRYMALRVFGTDNYLRSQIQAKMERLREDDKMILEEGVDSLSVSELHSACQARGIRIIGVSPARLRDDLSQWLDLHVKHQIPSTILILSRAFVLSDQPLSIEGEEKAKQAAQALQETLTSLPEEVVSEAELLVSETEGKATYKQKLDVIARQEELIAEELKSEQREEAIRREEKEAEAATKKVDAAHLEEVPDARLSKKQLIELRDVLSVLSQNTKVVDSSTTTATPETAGAETPKTAEASSTSKKTMSTTLLANRLEKSVAKLDQQIAEYDSRLSSELGKYITTNEQGQLTLEDLEKVLKLIKSSPVSPTATAGQGEGEQPNKTIENNRIKQIVRRLDVDDDGLVNLHEIVQFAKELEAQEGIGVNLEESASDSNKATAATPSTGATPSPSNLETGANTTVETAGKKEGEARKLKKEDIVSD